MCGLLDVLADARARPSGTAWAAQRLGALGATVREIQRSDPPRGLRFDLDSQIIDILAPDGLCSAGAVTTGKLQTIQIPGGTQALSRTEVVQIVVDGTTAALRRPKLVAAILLKARALRVHSRPEDQRHDLVTLLSLLNDPRAARAELTNNEVGWLRSISDLPSLDDPSLQENFKAAQLRTARAAYRMLVA